MTHQLAIFYPQIKGNWSPFVYLRNQNKKIKKMNKSLFHKKQLDDMSNKQINKELQYYSRYNLRKVT